MPDIAVVFFNGAVRGEEAGFGNVDKSSSCPVGRIAGIVCHGLLFSHNVGVKIRESLEPGFVDQLIFQSLQMLFMSIFQHFFSGKEVDGPFQVGVAFVPVFCTVISFCIAVDDLIAALAEDVDIFCSNCLRNFYIGSVHSSQCESAVEHKLHISGSGSLFGSKADLLGKITGRDHSFSGSNIIVFYKNKLHPWRYVRIVGNDFG